MIKSFSVEHFQFELNSATSWWSPALRVCFPKHYDACRNVQNGNVPRMDGRLVKNVNIYSHKRQHLTLCCVCVCFHWMKASSYFINIRTHAHRTRRQDRHRQASCLGLSLLCTQTAVLCELLHAQRVHTDKHTVSNTSTLYWLLRCVVCTEVFEM